MALTADQLADLQADLAIDDSEAVFSDAELERLYARAGDSYPTAVYYGWRQLLAGAAKFIDYRVAQTQESRAQVFDHIKAMLAYWQDESEKALNTQGVAIVGMTPIPPRWKDVPYENDGDGTRLRRLRRRGY